MAKLERDRGATRILLVVLLLCVVALMPLPDRAFAEMADDADIELTEAASNVTNGTWGTCIWTLTEDGTLTVKPDGQSRSLGTYLQSPWYNNSEFAERITSVVFKSGANDQPIFFDSYSSKLFSPLVNVTSIDMTATSLFRVTDASEMFANCASLSSITGSWEDFHAQSMISMFEGCSSLVSLDTSRWNTSSMTSMKWMFARCSALSSLDVSGWDTSRVQDMTGAFAECSALASLDVSHWDTSQVQDMTGAFAECSALASLDVSHWDTSQVQVLTGMFEGCAVIASLDVSHWNTANVISLVSMFEGCSSLTSLDLSLWDTSKAEDMSSLFSDCGSLTTINVGDLWSTESLMTSEGMFAGCNSLIGENGTEFDSSFDDATYAHVDMPDNPGYLSGRVASDIAYASVAAIDDQLYDDGREIKPTPAVTLSGRQLVEGTDFTYSYTDNAEVGIATVIISGMGIYAGSKTATFKIAYDFEEAVITLSQTFFVYTNEDCCPAVTVTWRDCSLERGKDFTVSYRDNRNKGYGVVVVTGMDEYLGRQELSFRIGEILASGSWGSCDWDINDEHLLTVHPGEGSNQDGLFSPWDETGQKIDRVVFAEEDGKKVIAPARSQFLLRYLQATSIDASGLDTSGVEDMSYMFFECRHLETIDVSGWDTSSVKDMQHMFAGCSSLESVDVVSWDTSAITNMDHLFDGCASLKSLNLAAWNTASTRSMTSLFEDCASLKLLDLSYWDTSVVESTSSMFMGCTSLKTIVVGPFWSLDQGQPGEAIYDGMFEGCTSLVGGNGTVYDPGHTNVKYACIDTDQTPGYLTEMPRTDISNTVITGVEESYIYSGGAIEPEVSVKLGDVSLIEGSDYVVSYANNISTGTATITITGTRYYKGTVEVTFRITGTSIAEAEVTFGADAPLVEGVPIFAHTGSAIEPTVSIALEGTELVESTDYTVAYEDNADVGTARVIVTGCGAYEGSLEVPFAIKADIQNLSVEFDGASYDGSGYPVYTYTGMAIEPALTVTYLGEALMVGEDYTVFYASNIDLGIAQLTITGTGRCFGTRTLEYVIAEDSNYLAVGTWGTCPWEITYSGVLTVHPGEGKSQQVNSSPWHSYVANITAVVFAEEDGQKVIAPVSMYALFGDLGNLVSVDGTGLDTSQTEDMRNLFSSCSSLAEVDVSTWNVERVEDLWCAFSGCTSLTSLDLSTWHTPCVTRMNGLFANCTSLEELDLSNWDTSSVSSMDRLFYYTTALRKVTLGASFSFYGVNQESSIQLADLPTGVWRSLSDGYLYSSNGIPNGVSTTTYVLDDTWHLSGKCWWSVDDGGALVVKPGNRAEEGELASWNSIESPWYSFRGVITSARFEGVVHAVTCRYMFSGCSKLASCDLSGLDVSNVTDMSCMFANCTSLSTIYVGVGWSTVGTSKSSAMFSGCMALVGGKGTAFDSKHTDAEYARIDTEETPGYLTDAALMPLPKDLAYACVNYIPPRAYDGTTYEPAIMVTHDDVRLVAGKDYTITYANNKNAGTATATIVGMGFFTGSISVTFEISKAVQTIATSCTSKELVTGKTFTLAGKSASGAAVAYTTSNKNVATVTANGVIKGVKAGTATITITAPESANYKKETKSVKVKVGKANPLTAKRSKAKVTASLSTLKKKTVTLASNIKITKKGQGKVTYANVSTNAVAKKFKVTAKNGKVTVPKGTKKGTYTIKVRVKAAGNSSYISGTKTVTYKIVVK